MGSRDLKPPPTWGDVKRYAESFKYKPIDILKMVHDKTSIKTKMEVFMIYGLIHRLLETVKPKKIKSDNHTWFLKKMPEGTTLTLDGRRYKTRSWRTNETHLHFVIAHYESDKNNSGINYIKHFENFKKQLFKSINQEKLKDLKIIVTLTSICGYYDRSAQHIVSQQKKLGEIYSNLIVTKVTDNLDSNFRRDGCHFNMFGIERITDEISEIINKSY